LPNDSYSKLLKLCIKMNEIELYNKILSRLGKSKNIKLDRKKGLLLLLENLYCNEPINK
jgi:hypothetical protein